VSSELILAHALPPPTATAGLKRAPEHFIVDEELGFTPGGGGEHLWLHIEKRNENTEQLARKLARWAGVKPMAVSYSGMKDRFAVTRQWLSIQVPGAKQRELDLSTCPATVLEHTFHSRKLKRGTHRGNRFDILLAAAQCDRDDIAERIAFIAQHGVPNYFGEQRFGRDGDNVKQALAMFSGESKPVQHLRGILLSAARSHLFNAVLSQRVQDGSWLNPIAGDVCGLDGSGSVFACDATDSDTLRRLQSGDVHLTGPLWGVKNDTATGQTSGVAAALEIAVLDQYGELRRGLESAGLSMERRALRLLPRQLRADWQGDDLRLQFYLTKGAFATTVLRELITRETITADLGGAIE